MSEYEYSDLLGQEDQGQQGGGTLRKLLEDTLAENKKLRERFEKADREKAVTSLLKEKGFDPEVSSLIPEGADAKEWIDKNAKFLKTAEAPVPEEGQEENPEPEVTDEQRAAAEALQQERLAMETLIGPDTGIPSTATADAVTKLQSFQSEEELLAFLDSQRGTSDRPRSLM